MSTFPTRKICLCLVLGVLSALSACGGAAAPSAADQLSVSQASTYADFKFSSGDSVDTARHDAFHVWATVALRISMPQRLQYNKYRNLAHIEAVTGQASNGFAEPDKFTVHSIWTFDPHEATHVYTSLFGRPSDFFNEGIAVALAVDPLSGVYVSKWNGTPIDDVARSMKRAGTLPIISGMTATAAFRNVNDQTSYPVSGSFVSFVLAQRGIDAMRAFFAASSRNDSGPAIDTQFRAAFGWTVAEADAAWRVFLG